MTKRIPSGFTADILIVDDTPANLQLLVNLLSVQRYRIRPVTSGEAALKAVALQAPDLVLLDINMPGMNGYEVCKRLKRDPDTAHIPIIFISALTEVAEKVNAFSAGGVDYVTKPFQVEEILARVGTHLALRRSRLELEQSLARLRELEELRDSLTHMIAHDMRSPLLSVGLGLEIMEDEFRLAEPPARKLITDARVCVSTLVGMVTQMLDVSRLEHGNLPLERKDFDLAKAAAEVVELLQGSREHEFGIQADGPVMVSADRELLRRVLDNLITNAVKFTPKQGRITVSLKPAGPDLRVEVVDQGPGISAEKQARLFTKFGQLEASEAKRGFGLGLAFVRLAIEAHGGQVGVSSQPGQGSTFWFTLPRRPDQALKSP